MSSASIEAVVRPGRRARQGKGDERIAVALLLSVAVNAAVLLIRFDAEDVSGVHPPKRPHVAVLSTRTLQLPATDHAATATIDTAVMSPPPARQTASVSPPDPTGSPLIEAGPSVVHPIEQAATALASASAPAPDYVKTSDLDKSPVPLAEIAPDYPATAGSRLGHVVLELFIGDTGIVDRVDVLSATPPGVFDDSARSAFLQAKFEPGRRHGVASRTRMTIEVDYRPADHADQLPTTRY